MVIESSVTDRFPVAAVFSNIKKAKHSTQASNNLKPYTDLQQIKSKLAQQDWTNVLEQTDVNRATEQFILTLTETIRTTTTARKISSRYKKLKPWITTGLAKSIRRR